jgi:hypothetical protein
MTEKIITSTDHDTVFLVDAFFFSFSGWGETESTCYVGQCWPIVRAPDDRWWWLWSSRWNEDWQGRPKYSERTCPSATLSTTNPTGPDLGSNPGRRGGKPASNRLSYGTAPRRWLETLLHSQDFAIGQCPKSGKSTRTLHTIKSILIFFSYFRVGLQNDSVLQF